MKTWTDKQSLGNGIVLYKNVIKKELDVINRLESNISAIDSNETYTWRPAYVGYQQLMPEYRDCQDFKFRKEDIAHDPSEKSFALQSLWQDLYDVQFQAVED